jgi:hypothetical protein
MSHPCERSRINILHWIRMLILECSQGCYVVKILFGDLDLWPWKSIGFQILLREYDTVARADNYFVEYRMLFLRRHSNERDIFHGSCIDVIISRLRKNLKAPASSRIMPFLKEGEIRRRKKCSEHLKDLDRNVGETEVDQTRRRPDRRKPWNWL